MTIANRTTTSRRLLRPAQGPSAAAAAGGAVRHAAAAACARSAARRAGRSAHAVRRRRRRAPRKRLRRRRASDRGGRAASAHRLHRHRAVRQRHGQGAGRDRRAQARQHPAASRRRDRPAGLAAGGQRSRASICSIPIRGRSGGTGSGASCRTRASRRSRASCGRAANSASPATFPDYVAWTLVRLLRSPRLRLDRRAGRRLAQAVAGLHRHALRGEGDARRPRALLSDFPANMTRAQAASPGSLTCQNRTTRCAVDGATAARNWR